MDSSRKALLEWQPVADQTKPSSKGDQLATFRKLPTARRAEVTGRNILKRVRRFTKSVAWNENLKAAGEEAVMSLQEVIEDLEKLPDDFDPKPKKPVLRVGGHAALREKFAKRYSRVLNGKTDDLEIIEIDGSNIVVSNGAREVVLSRSALIVRSES
jgi:hypothetical protein